MGSYEIFNRNSADNIQDIVEIETPSPLTSSHSSDSCKSLLNGINELISGLPTNRVKKFDDSSTEEAEEEKYLKRISSTDRINENSFKKENNEETLSDFDSTSLESSPSSLKRRLRNLPSPNEDIRLADRVAALDRRISRERDVYLQLQELADRIEEKDEVETSSLTDNTSIPKLHLENHSSTLQVNMCSSAPETMRLKTEAFEQTLPDVATCFKKPLTKNFNERRPPKYLQPLDAPIKEILRCNAPPLCLSDKRIAELLRRGSISAREEYLKKSSNAPTKLVGYRKPTGVIIKNLSSGSEDDCTNQWLIRDSTVSKFESEAPVSDNSKFQSHGLDNEVKSSIPEVLLIEKVKINNQDIEHEESESYDYHQSSQSAKTVQKSSTNGKTRLNGNTEVSDNPLNSGSRRLMKASFDNSMAKLKSVLKDIDSNSRDSRPLNVPKLEIQSQDYSHSTSQASREDSTKRSLDVRALIRALSDVSIKQQEFVDRKVQSEVDDSVISRSTEPKSSAYTSVANGSRQSIVSIENELHEAKNNYLKSLHLSRDSISDYKKIKCNDGKSNVLSNIPIVTRATNDILISKLNLREPHSIVRKKVDEEDNDIPEREHTTKKTIVGSLPSKKFYKCRSTDFIETNKCPVKLLKIKSPEIKKKTSKSPRYEATIQNKSFRIAKKNFQSYDSLMQNYEKLDKNRKVTGDPAVVLSEPVTSRNGRIISQDLSSRGMAGSRDIFPQAFIDDPLSSDDRFKYLQRGSKIPYKRSSSSSCDSTNKDEESEFKPKIISPSVTGFQSFDQLKNEAKFTIYEDTIEASPKSEKMFPIEKLNTAESSLPRTSKFDCELHRSGSTSTYVNEHSVSNERNPNLSSPEDIDHKIFQMNDKENSKNMQNTTKSKNIFWADSSVELNRAMNCTLESRNEVENYSTFPEAQSCLISPTTSSKKKSSCSSRSSPRIFHKRPSIVTESSGSPRYRYDERKLNNENIFPSFVVAKKLSYSELQDSHSKDNNSDKDLMPEEENFQRDHRDTLSPEELNEDIASNCSETNLAITGRSEGTVHQFRKAFDRVTTRTKVSCSLSKLTRSPIDRNITSRRKSQERFPFTISESTSAKSSSKFRVENMIPASSDCVIIEPSETAYKPRIHPSLLRLASAGIEDKPEEIIRSASNDMVIRVERRNFVTKFVGRFSSKLKKSQKREEKPDSGGTKVLYENRKCRVSSAEESSGSEDTEKASRQFNRNGLWVEGLQDEVRSGNADENNRCHDTEELQDSKDQDLIDRYTNFLVERERLQKQFNGQDFVPRTPMNSLIINEDSDSDPGCFCVKICHFLIGEKIHSRKRSSLFRRARRYKLRRF